MRSKLQHNLFSFDFSAKEIRVKITKKIENLIFFYKKIIYSDLYLSFFIFLLGFFLFCLLIFEKITNSVLVFPLLILAYLTIGVGLYGIGKWFTLQAVKYLKIFIRLIRSIKVDFKISQGKLALKITLNR